MSKTTQISVRVDEATAARLDELAARMNKEAPVHQIRPIGRSDAARAALAAGLLMLEEEERGTPAQ